jgi:hypothetical protein
MALLVHDNREIRLNCLKVLVNISLYGSCSSSLSSAPSPPLHLISRATVHVAPAGSFNSLILDSPHFSNLTIFLLSSDDDLALRAVAILGNLSTRDGTRETSNISCVSALSMNALSAALCASA